MKARLWILSAAAVLVLGGGRTLLGQNFDIRLELIHGSGVQEEAQEPDTAVAIYPLSLARLDAGRGESSARQETRLDGEIARIYNLRTVYGLAHATLRWDGGSAWIPGIFMVEHETFRLDLEPKFLPPGRMKIRLLVSRSRNRAGDLERLLDTDIVVSLDDPTVVGFSYGGQPLFLSVEVTRTKPASSEPPGGAAGTAGRERPVAPMPVRRVAPRLPEDVDASMVRGEIVLRVTVDPSGNVSDVQVLRSLGPDIDREVVQALRQWTFEPVRDEHGPRAASLAMAFRFGGVPWESMPPAAGSDVDEEPTEPTGRTGQETPATAPAELERILDATEKYCRKLHAAALDFVCQERISEDLYDYVQTTDFNSRELMLNASKRIAKKNRLLYDYQMIKTAQGIRESRTLLEDNGKRAQQPNAPLLTKRFYSYRPLFGPVGLFSAEQRPLFNYRISGKDKIRDRKAWIIEASPKPGSRPDTAFGKAWIDQETTQILKIEVDDRSLAGMEKLLDSYDLARMKPVFLTTHYYEVEKNGLMFPSRTTFVESFTVLSNHRRFQRSRTEISFTDYRFFTVETQTTIKD